MKHAEMHSTAQRCCFHLEQGCVLNLNVSSCDLIFPLLF